ncbi:MAG: amidohydrolase [Thermodesulfobacteriota bacterium]|nr:amidohydrolase [Thermodesulfobacteriota bacterium]
MKEADIIISGGIVLPMDEKGSVIENGAIVISGQDIVAIGQKEEIDAQYISSEVLDARNHLIMPGLINGHTHAAMTYFRGLADDLELMDWLNNYIFPAEAKFVDKEFAYLGSMLACAEMIRSGTTTFCDMYIFEDEVARAAKKAGLRCLVGEVLFDFPSPNVKTPDEGVAYTRMLLEKWSGDPLVNIVVEPHSLYTCSYDLLKKAKALAKEYNAPIGTHFLETTTEREQITGIYGKPPDTVLKEVGFLDEDFIAFHGVWLTKGDLALFADNGCKVVHNPESNMKLASGVAPIPDMLEKGITVGLGTDGCASNNNLDMFQEMDMAAKLHKVHRLDPTVMDAQTVTRMATCEGAKAIGIGKKVGALKVGMKADIITIDLNKPHLTPMYNAYSHLVYAAGGSDVDTVVINGKVVMKDQRLLTIDENDIMERIGGIARAIKQSFGKRDAESGE